MSSTNEMTYENEAGEMVPVREWRGCGDYIDTHWGGCPVAMQAVAESGAVAQEDLNVLRAEYGMDEETAQDAAEALVRYCQDRE